MLRRAVAAALLLLAGCGGSHARGDCAPAGDPVLRRLDAASGSFGPVRLGAPRGAAVAALGARRHHASRTTTATLVRCGAPETGLLTGPYPFVAERYSAFTLVFAGAPSTLAEIDVIGRGVRTEAGVGIGSRLAAVRAAYPQAVCGTQDGDDGPLGPSCVVTTPPRRLYFGGDPVREIDLR